MGNEERNDIEVNTIDPEVFKVEERCKEYTDEKIKSLGKTIDEIGYKQEAAINDADGRILGLTEIMHTTVCNSCLHVVIGILIIAAFIIAVFTLSSKMRKLESTMEYYRTEISIISDQLEEVQELLQD